MWVVQVVSCGFWDVVVGACGWQDCWLNCCCHCYHCCHHQQVLVIGSGSGCSVSSRLFWFVLCRYCWEGAVAICVGHMCWPVWHHQHCHQEAVVVVIIGRWVLVVHLTDAGCKSSNIDLWWGWCKGKRGVLVGWVLCCCCCCQCHHHHCVIVAVVG